METKAYLEQHGVVLSSFSTKARSNTIILVKIIPYGTTEAQIREMFEIAGVLRTTSRLHPHNLVMLNVITALRGGHPLPVYIDEFPSFTVVASLSGSNGG